MRAGKSAPPWFMVDRARRRSRCAARSRWISCRPRLRRAGMAVESTPMDALGVARSRARWTSAFASPSCATAASMSRACTTQSRTPRVVRPRSTMPSTTSPRSVSSAGAAKNRSPFRTTKAVLGDDTTSKCTGGSRQATLTCPSGPHAASRSRGMRTSTTRPSARSTRGWWRIKAITRWKSGSW